MKTVIKNVNVVTASEVLYNSAVQFENGVITKIGEYDSADKVIDGKGGYLIPGFIDLHCHGGIELDFIDATKEEIKEIESFHLAHATPVATALAPVAFYTTFSKKQPNVNLK